jgi:hypothetical protein
MNVIPDFVIDDWKKQYDEGSELWAKYPEFDAQDRQMIRSLAALDEQVVRNAALPRGGFVTQACPLYLPSAGAPLAGKSTVMDFTLAARPGLRDEAVKVDPDRWGMTFMMNLYHGYLMSAGMVADVPAGEGYSYAQRRAYDIARPASNYITLELMNEAVEKKCHIVHGTTMTSPHAAGLLQNMRSNGYEIEMLLCGAFDSTRAAAAEYRANVQGYYQATPEDVKSKGDDFPRRLKDYFANADRLQLFWRGALSEQTFEDGGVTEKAVNIATLQNGAMDVKHKYGMQLFERDYDMKRGKIYVDSKKEEQLPSAKELVDIYAETFRQRRGGQRFYGRKM